jgi:predicted DNA-binding transcriptional regulator AlpA
MKQVGGLERNTVATGDNRRRCSRPQKSISVISTALTWDRKQAAVRCGISIPTFDAWVKKGILPRPIPGTRRWSRVAVERALGIDANAITSLDSPFEEWKRAHAH